MPYAIRCTPTGLAAAGALALLVTAGMPTVTWGQETKLSGADLCYTCHPELKAKFAQAHVHAPIAMGACETCHNPHTARFPKLLVKQGSDLCFTCHQDMKGPWTEGSVHAPIRQGNCLSCHDAHASANAHVLKQSADRLCVSCHQKLASAAKTVKHMPFESGDCMLCHRAHTSRQGSLLAMPSTELCRSCHDLADAKVKRAHGPFTMERSRCESCHAPHGSVNKGLVKDVAHQPFAQRRCGACHQLNGPDPTKTFLQGSELCATCHAKQVRDFRKKLVHKPVADGQCTACHSPHASNVKGLMSRPEREVCLTCHADVTEKFRASKAFHPASAADGKCTICHVPHGSDRPWLAPRETLQTCSACHQTHAALSHPMGPGVIDPRTKTTMDCLSCHDPHGTQFEKFITFPKERDLCIQCHRGTDTLRTRPPQR